MKKAKYLGFFMSKFTWIVLLLDWPNDPDTNNGNRNGKNRRRLYWTCHIYERNKLSYASLRERASSKVHYIGSWFVCMVGIFLHFDFLQKKKKFDFSALIFLLIIPHIQNFEKVTKISAKNWRIFGQFSWNFSK